MESIMNEIDLILEKGSRGNKLEPDKWALLGNLMLLKVSSHYYPKPSHVCNILDPLGNEIYKKIDQR